MVKGVLAGILIVIIICQVWSVVKNHIELRAWSLHQTDTLLAGLLIDFQLFAVVVYSALLYALLK